MNRVTFGVLMAAATLAVMARADETAAGRYPRRWFYAAYNLQVPANVSVVEQLLERAAKAGYNGMVLADYKLQILDRVPDFYFKHAEQVKRKAASLQIELIPAVFPIGYSSGLLSHDPNLAEGPPVIDAPFVARNGEAVPDGKPVRLVNGDMEYVKGNKILGFSFQDDPGKISFVDRGVVHGGSASCRFENVGKGGSGNGRLIQRVAVRPHTAYRLAAWVRTRDLKPTGDLKLLALGGRNGRPLTFLETKTEATSDWHQIDVVFNSLDETEVNIYAGQWGGGTGTFWLDDLTLREVGLVNVLRRPGCPFTVRNADGTITYEEGKDYAPFADPLLGQVPYAGEYDYDHAAAPLRLTADSRIKEGDRLRVSWYHPIIIHGEQVCCSLVEPKVYELLADQARRVHALFQPATYFFSHDELRVAGWCELSRKSGKTPGQLLAENVGRCAAIVREVNPTARMAVWSDMFDPNHNAVNHYYLVNGDLAGSWNGLPKEITIVNWNSGKAAASLKFFADRGHEQVIAGFYDGDERNFRHWQEAAKGIDGVNGFMYTTWQSRYQLLERYGELMRNAR